MPGDLPVMAVSAATTPRETRLVSRLDAIARDALEADMAAPVLFIVGRVVELHRPEAVQEVVARAGRRVPVDA